MSGKLKAHELEISRQAAVISQLCEMISRLEALITPDRKYKPEVQEPGRNIWLLEF